MMNMFSERVHSRAGAKTRTEGLVVEAARALFLRDGFQGATVRDIAARAGVSTGTVMSVGDKESLLIKVYDAEIMRRIGEEVPWPQGRPPAEQAVAVLAPFLDLFGSTEPLFREYARAAIRGVSKDHALGERLAMTQNDLARTLAAAGLGESDAQFGSGVLINVYLGQLMMWVSGHAGPAGAAAAIGATAAWIIDRKADIR